MTDDEELDELRAQRRVLYGARCRAEGAVRGWQEAAHRLLELAGEAFACGNDDDAHRLREMSRRLLDDRGLAERRAQAERSEEDEIQSIERLEAAEVRRE